MLKYSEQHYDSHSSTQCINMSFFFAFSSQFWQKDVLNIFFFNSVKNQIYHIESYLCHFAKLYNKHYVNTYSISFAELFTLTQPLLPSNKYHQTFPVTHWAGQTMTFSWYHFLYSVDERQVPSGYSQGHNNSIENYLITEIMLSSDSLSNTLLTFL